MLPPPPPSPSPSAGPPCVPSLGENNGARAHDRHPAPAPETETSTPLLAQHSKLLTALLCSTEREEAKHALFRGFVEMFNNRLRSGSGSHLELPNDLASLTLSFENILRTLRAAIQQEESSLPHRILRVEREVFCQCLTAVPACVEVTEAMRIAAARNNDDDDEPCARQVKIIRTLKERREDIFPEVPGARLVDEAKTRQEELERVEKNQRELTAFLAGCQLPEVKEGLEKALARRGRP